MSDTLEFNKLVDSAYDAFYNGSSEQLRAIFLRIKTLYAESVLARCDESKQAPAGTLNRDAIQQKALDCGFQYWRASDAHGVIATSAQAVDLLQDLLGVEVEIKEQAPAVEANDRELDAHLIDRLSKLLAEIALILNSEPGPLTRPSYHDLPDKVRAIQCEVELLRSKEFLAVEAGAEGALIERLKLMLSGDAAFCKTSIARVALEQAIVALARASEAKQPTEPGASIYVECCECVECGHIGINDSHDTDAACGYPCGWTGPSPIEDKCPGCQRENVMGAACPKCSGRYSILAEAILPAAKLVSVSASEAATTDSTRERIAQALHYPACWDTAAYPTLESAVWESIACAKLGCSECGGASEAAAGEPVAYVPVHPRTGPLWANTVPTLDSERPEHYPVRALCYAAPQPASEQSSCPASWNAIVPPPNDSAPVFDGAQPASEQQGDDFIGILTVKRFRGADSMVNTDFEYLGNLPDGSYRCYLHPAEQQAASVAPSKRERLIKKVLKLLNEHGFVDPRDGYARVRGRGFAKNLVDTLAAKGDGQ